MRVRTAAGLLSLAACLALSACAAETSGNDVVNDDVDLTSLTARQRSLSFEGVVYAEPRASDDAILEIARAQARSAFGALLHYEVAVQTREVQNVDAKSFKKRDVTVVDPSVPGDAGHAMLEVKYTYRDNAVVPVKMSQKTALNIALISAGGESKTKDIVTACTKNDHEAHEDAEAGLLWYDFDPSRGTCRSAIESEAKKIEADADVTPERAPSAVAAMGVLNVGATPWGTVSGVGIPANSTTPRQIDLVEGMHDITVTMSEGGGVVHARTRRRGQTHEVHGITGRARVRIAQLIAIVLAVSPAFAGGRDDLSRAASAWSEYEYERVVEAAETALASPDLTAKDRVEALRLRGSALIILERAPDAEAVFAKIFALDPDYTLPANTPPRIRSVFDPARARWQVAEQERLSTELGSQLAALELRVELPRSPRGGRPIVIGVDLADPSHVASSIILAHRRAGEGYYTLATVPARPGHSALTIPGELTASRTPYTLELHIQARHRSGVTLRREGEPDKPLSLSVAAGQVPTSTPITRRWWFWASIGVVAIGTGLLVREAVDVGGQTVEIHP